MISGTIRNSVKLQQLDSLWQQKKNDINANKQQKEMTPEERTIAQFQEQMEKERESNSHADTYNKLASGGELTSEEISYLQEHDPEALAKYREAQAEKKAYENELKNCKTKDEVERLKMNHMGNFAAQAKKITNDPYIPLDKKLELMNQLNNKVCLVNEAHLKFMKSEQYKDMPTDQELSKERIDETSKEQDRMQEEVNESVSKDSKVNDTDESVIENSVIENSVIANSVTTNSNTDNSITGNDDTDIIDTENRIDGIEVISTNSATSKNTNELEDDSAKEDMRQAEREKKILGESEKDIDSGISFEKISDSIRKFVIMSGNQNSNINIGL